ncbi:hypothetical protein FHT76_007836 [Rhizobium sp. BK176]|nr:hypothetical protein [Rhizobium sp. BK176]
MLKEPPCKTCKLAEAPPFGATAEAQRGFLQVLRGVVPYL